MQKPPPRPPLFLVFLAALLATALFRPAGLRAATLVPLTLEDLDRLSSDVVVGTVLDTKAAWDADHRLIETTVRIRVDRRVKGRGAAVMTVVVPGGAVGDVGMRRPGSARFIAGERVLLFAEPRGPRGKGTLRPVGMLQGKMTITRDEARGLDLVVPPGPAWGAEGQPIPPGTEPAGPPPPLPLDTVLQRLGRGR